MVETATGDHLMHLHRCPISESAPPSSGYSWQIFIQQFLKLTCDTGIRSHQTEPYRALLLHIIPWHPPSTLRFGVSPIPALVGMHGRT